MFSKLFLDSLSKNYLGLCVTSSVLEFIYLVGTYKKNNMQMCCWLFLKTESNFTEIIFLNTCTQSYSIFRHVVF